MIECPDFLPLGSVVRLRGSDKTFFVVSRALVVGGDDGEKEYYDYGFALYPEGLVGDAVVYSNHDCVTEVLFEGFKNDDDRVVLEGIREVLALTDVPRAHPQPSAEW